MRHFFYYFICLISPFQFYSQTPELKVNYKDSLYKIRVSEFHENLYFSLSDFIYKLSLPNYSENNNTLESDFEKGKLSVTAGHPFLVVKNKNDNSSRIFQLPVSVFTE